jgi:hypothetical protein
MGSTLAPVFDNLFMGFQRWSQHDLVGGGRGMLCQLWCRVVPVMRAARPSNLLDYCKVLLDYCKVLLDYCKVLLDYCT